MTYICKFCGYQCSSESEMIGHLWEEHVRDDESIDISEHTPDEFYSVVSGK